MPYSLGILHSIVEASVAGIITVDSHGVVQTFRPSAECLFGYKPSEVVSHNASVIMPEADQSKQEGHLGRYLSFGDAHVISVGREFTGRRMDGTLAPEHISVVELPVDGPPMFTGMVLDLRSKK